MSNPFPCPSCNRADMQIFLKLEQVPVHQNLIYKTEADAQNTLRGDIHLACCPVCGFVANAAFDPNLLNYSEVYDNTQCFSPSFNEYMTQLATTLIDRYDLHDKHIIEIGCGKGDFIKLLCQRGPNQGIGFDPTYIGDELDESGRVRFVKDFYTEAYADEKGDFFCSRHVIEHVPRPSEMMTSLRRAIGERHDAAIFFETPDVSWIFRNVTFWDIFYEHCSLFTPGSIARLYAAHGFDTTRVNTVFGGQYMWAEAVPASTATGTIQPAIDDVASTFANIDYFMAHYTRKMDDARLQIAALNQQGKRIAAWGAGAKAVTYLNSLEILPDSIPYVVDINPRKQGNYTAGTGQQIIAPEVLTSYAPDTILVMNPNYVDEIRSTLSDLNLSPEILVL